MPRTHSPNSWRQSKPPRADGSIKRGSAQLCRIPLSFLRQHSGWRPRVHRRGQPAMNKGSADVGTLDEEILRSETAWGRLLSTIGRVPIDRTEEPGVCGDWSLKSLL